MKRTILILALTLGVTLAFLPACCVQAEGTASAVTDSVKVAASIIPDHVVFRQTNAAVGPWVPGVPGPEYDQARRDTAAFVRDYWHRRAKMTSFEIASTAKPLDDVYRAFEALFAQNHGQILSKDERDQTMVIIVVDEDHAYLIIAVHNDNDGGAIVSISDLEKQRLEDES